MSSRPSNHFKDDNERSETSYRDTVHPRPAYGTIVRNASRYDGEYPSTSNEAYLREDTSEEYSISGTSCLTFVTGPPRGKTHILNEQFEITDYPDGDMDDEELMYRIYQPLPLKDFSQELRAHKDVDHYLCNTMLLLDVDESNTEDIVQLMIEQILERRQPLVLNMANLMKSIFALNRADVLSKTIQGVRISQMNTLHFDQSWICMLCEWPSKIKRHTVIARLLNPVNMGSTSQEVSFVILVVASNKEKSTKSVVETARTFCTIFADMECRYRLREAENVETFRNILKEETRMLFGKFIRNAKNRIHQEPNEAVKEEKWFSIGQGIYDDLKQRLPHYRSDFKDGVCSRRAWRKVIPTTFFLYFACVLPILAFGMLNENNTHGNIGLQNVLFGQCLGGIIFSLIGGQAMNILLTTAPLTLFTRVVSKICDDFSINFLAMFACVGLWNSIFLSVYAVLDMCKLRKWSTRSSDEIFSTLVAFILFSDVIRDVYNNFKENYSSCHRAPRTANPLNLTSLPYHSGHPRFISVTDPKQVIEPQNMATCHRDISLLFLLLMLSTLWLTTTLSNFTKTPYLSAQKRQLLADFALPLAIIIITAVSNIFRDIPMRPLDVTSALTTNPFRIAPLHQLSPGAIVTAFFLGFSLSLLFFTDHNISSSYISDPYYKLKKGHTYHWDLLVVAIINIPLSMFGCPWMHAAMTVSPLHVKSMARMEDRVEQGDIHQIIVNVRETRVTSLISHIMLGLSLLLLPWPLPIIPRPVLNGYFLYLGVTYLSNKQIIDRTLLLITEQGAYPPNHYIRRVPQREMHKYTVLQLCQLLLLSFCALVPVAYIQMFFPFGIISLIFIRHRLVPQVMETKHLAVLD